MKVTTHYVAFWALLILAQIAQSPVSVSFFLGFALISILAHFYFGYKEQT